MKQNNAHLGNAAHKPDAKWSPSTASNAPQPAGHQCADWYEREHPTAEDMLYALAHTKGEADRLRQINADLVAALQKISGGNVMVHETGGESWTMEDVVVEYQKIASAALKLAAA